MRIGVDCHVLTGKFQGSRTYLEQLYREVLKLNRNHTFLFFGHWHEEQPFGPQVEYVRYPSESRWRRLGYQAGRLVGEQQLDLFHSTYIAPLRMAAKSLVVIHDILFETHPQYFTRALVLRNRFLVRRSARRAVQIHTVSSYCREQLIQRYGVKPDLIHIVPDGVDLSEYFPHGKEDARRFVTKRFGIPDQYILTVGRLEPRKNHTGLLMAYARVRERWHDAPPLVIVGQPDFGYDALYRLRRELRLERDVHILSNVSYADLPLVYRAASLFVYPSFAEGFGIPPLEAMASGVPVVVSNRTAIPEVVGDSGMLVDPTDTEAIADSMRTLLEDSELRRNLGVAGRARAQQWTWTQTAHKYLKSVAMLGDKTGQEIPFVEMMAK